MITLFFSMSFFIGLLIIGFMVHGIKIFNLFLPDGVPVILMPLLVAIEFVSFFARVISLAVRLAINLMAGHTLLKILCSFVSVKFSLIVIKALSVIFVCYSTPFLIFGFLIGSCIIILVLLLEFIIAFLQVYIFFILMTLYLNDIINLH